MLGAFGYRLRINYRFILLCTVHILPSEVPCKLLFVVRPVLHCVAMLPFPGKVSCAEAGGSEEGQPGSGHLNSLFYAMTLEETAITDCSVNQLASLNCHLCGNRGVLLLCFIAKSKCDLVRSKSGNCYFPADKFA